MSTDPDYNDPVKAAYRGSGHDGSNGRIEVTWIMNVWTSFQNMVTRLTDVETPKDFILPNVQIQEHHKFIDIDTGQKYILIKYMKITPIILLSVQDS